jgi:hypothetical protein
MVSLYYLHGNYVYYSTEVSYFSGPYWSCCSLSIRTCMSMLRRMKYLIALIVVKVFHGLFILITRLLCYYSTDVSYLTGHCSASNTFFASIYFQFFTGHAVN